MAEFDYVYSPRSVAFMTKGRTIIVPTELLDKASFVVTNQESTSILDFRSGQRSFTLEIPNTTSDVVRNRINDLMRERKD